MNENRTMTGDDINGHVIREWEALVRALSIEKELEAAYVFLGDEY